VVSSGSYSNSGTLHGGSGHHVSIVQQPSSGEVTFLLTDPGGTAALPATVKPRIALARIR
jgi:hypothetical protein